MDEILFVRKNQDHDFNNHHLTNISSITLNTQAVNDKQVITKVFVDQFQQENKRSRRDLGIDFYNDSYDLVKNNQDKEFDIIKSTNLDSIAFNRNPKLDNEVAKKNIAMMN